MSYVIHSKLLLFVVLKAYGNLEALLLAIYDSVSKYLQKFYSVDGNIISPLKIPTKKIVVRLLT